MKLDWSHQMAQHAMPIVQAKQSITFLLMVQLCKLSIPYRQRTMNLHDPSAVCPNCCSCLQDGLLPDTSRTLNCQRCTFNKFTTSKPVQAVMFFSSRLTSMATVHLTLHSAT